MKNKPIWIAIHIYMETAQGISLCNYLHLKPAKTLSFLLISVLFFNKIREQESRTRSPQRRVGERVQIMYTHVSKCKNDKIKILKTNYNCLSKNF
jgi:hypothetical protein